MFDRVIYTIECYLLSFACKSEIDFHRQCDVVTMKLSEIKSVYINSMNQTRSTKQVF